MPPKKGKATPVKAKATAPDPPSTRSQRGTLAEESPLPKKAAASKAKALEPSTSSRGRGRPAKITQEVAEEAADEVAEPAKEPPKKRGRPSKVQIEEEPMTDAEPPKKRGRPSNAHIDDEEPAELVAAASSRGRGRPAKAKAAVEAEDVEIPKTRGRPAKAKAEVEVPKEAAETPKRRGRPAKAETAVEGPVEDAGPPKKRGRPATAKVDEAEVAPSKKRGRPAKETVDDAAEPPKKRGRPAKAKAAPAVTDDEQAPPRKRGRPPYGGETTKQDEDAELAAEQLEDELIAEAQSEASPTRKRKPKPSTTTAKKGKAKASLTGPDTDEAIQATESAGGKQYWLMKAEQEDREETTTDGSTVNTKFTIDDLRAKGAPELWDGVRNAGAAKNMRTMKQGDLAFFYASGGKQGRAPGIVGIMEIVSEAEEDITTTQKGSLYYEPNEKKRGNWCVVGVEFRKKLTKPVALKKLQEFNGAGPLGEMQLFKQSRLSVSKVTGEEWDFIVDNLVEGYEEDSEPMNGTNGAEMDDAPLQTEADDAMFQSRAGAHGAEEIPEEVDDALFEPVRTVAQVAEEIVEDAGLSETTAMPGTMPELALPSVESDLLTTDTGLASATAATSRPASRAASRQASRAPSAAVEKQVAVSSRAGSLAPSVSGRPSSRAGSLAPSVSARPSSRAGSLAPSASVRPSSRAGSLAPSVSARPSSRGSLAPSAVARPTSRGRSQTPKPRASSVLPMGSVTEEGGDAMEGMEAMDAMDAMEAMDAIAE
ncbi:hypothetical protein LTR85_009503 [Meristemomyces frigidus]|nr:hypothetical protein LTR85_009503 [Meristemomyces frigidus]